MRSLFISMLARHDKVGTEPDMLEVTGASFIADASYIFMKPNASYIERELAWYESMSLNVNDIPGGPPKIWRDVASTNGLINSNYGYLVYSEDNHSQFANALDTLRHDRDSRRAVMIYTRPSMHEDYAFDGMSDFVCTNVVQYVIRGSFLHAIVQMRSNDAVYGYRNDYAWQRAVQMRMLLALRRTYPTLVLGSMTWQVGSLHIYPRHFDHVRKAGAAS